jgi:hypothetical protein
MQRYKLLLIPQLVMWTILCIFILSRAVYFVWLLHGARVRWLALLCFVFLNLCCILLDAALCWPQQTYPVAAPDPLHSATNVLANWLVAPGRITANQGRLSSPKKIYYWTQNFPQKRRASNERGRVAPSSLNFFRGNYPVVSSCIILIYWLSRKSLFVASVKQ